MKPPRPEQCSAFVHGIEPLQGKLSEMDNNRISTLLASGMCQLR
jgi:hypothetical protein